MFRLIKGTSVAQEKNVSFSYPKISCVGQMLAVASAAAIVGVAAPALGQCELQTLWSPEGGADHFFGWAAAGSASMDVLVVGEFGNGDLAGAAYIYRRAGDVWELETTLVAPDGPSPFNDFGYRVGMSADGKTILISELRADHNGFFNTGALWVFVEDGGQWQAQQKLTASDAQDGWFLGEQVAISADGNTAVASATGAPGNPVYVFTRDGDRWSEAGTLPQPDNFSSFPNMAVSADGNVILVGSSGDGDFGQGAGAVYIFVRDAKSSKWLFRQKIFASDPDAHDNFGFAVSLSAGGDTVLVGASNDDEVGLSAGAVYVFERRGDLWFEQVKLLAPEPKIQDHFGRWLTITPDGQRAIIYGGGNTGYVFDGIDKEWVETMRIRPWSEDVLGLGKALDITDDGSIGLFGSPNSRVDGVLWYGAVVLFDLDAPLGDLDCDGFITAVDLLALLASWGPCDCEILGGCPADLDLDCTVGVGDLLILLTNWG